jgi:hypothetical protein
MDEFNAQIESKINKLKALTRGTETLMSTALGALREESIQHEGNATTKNHPRPLMRKVG